MTKSLEPYPLPRQPCVMAVTPEMAAHWVAVRFDATSQRKVSATTVKRYTEVMRAGKWLLTHQGIAFDRRGMLIDGSHRLRAVAASGATVTFWVMPDQDPGTFAVLDNGLKRQAAHLIHDPYSVIMASAARYLAVVAPVPEIDVEVIGVVQGGVYASGLDTASVLKTVQAWPELSDWAKDVSLCALRGKVNAPLHLAVLAQAARTRHAAQIPEWLHGLTTGADLPEGDPRLVLRSRFDRDGRALVSNTRALAYNLTVKAWNLHVAGRSVVYLKWMESEGLLRVAR